MDYYICGIGFVTPELIGCGRTIKTFDPKPGKIPSLSRKDVLDKPYKPFGRMDFFSKIGFAGTYFSFKDAGLFSTEHVVNNKTTDTAIIVSTYYRCLDNDYNFFNTFKLNNGKNASPALFAYALPNAFLGEASIFLKATGQCYAISEDNSDGISVLKLAFDTLNFKESEFVICGICDTNAPEFMKSFLNNTEDIFSGSLFFTISKTKQKYNYGKIREDENGNIFFNEKNIKNLLELAKICIKNKKI